MEGIFFWLVPVGLLVTLILVMLYYRGSVGAKKPLLLIEPLGTLIESWQLARVIGDERQAHSLLALFAAGDLKARSALEDVVRGLPLRSAPPQANLLHQERLKIWGERRVFETEGRVTSVLIGDIAEVLPLVKYRADGRHLLGEEERRELERTAGTAAKHGFLPVACALRYVHGRLQGETKSHSWVGLVLLEPQLARAALGKLRHFKASQAKFVSVLPLGLLEWLWAKAAGTEPLSGAVSAERSDHPKDKEEYWRASSLIAAASLRERYSVVRFLQHSYDCQLLSSQAEDEQLPLPHWRGF
jgi:hypothetical protein